MGNTPSSSGGGGGGGGHGRHGGGRRRGVSKQDRAILGMKMQRDRLKQYQRRLEGESARYEASARACLAAGRPDRARLVLQQRQLLVKNLGAVDQQLATIEGLAAQVEFSALEESVVLGLEQGGQVLKQLNARLTLDRIDRLADDTAEARAHQEEIANALAEMRREGGGLSVDDEESVEAEFERLQATLNQQQLDAMPSAPKTKLPTAPEAETALGETEAIEQDDQGQLSRTARTAMLAE
ncbi:Vacuolar protein sorting-associated protein 20 [Savitreella phatthalungensis]